MTWQRISVILSIIVSLVVIIGGFSAYTSRFAEAEDLIALKQVVILNQRTILLTQVRLEQKIVSDRISSLEERRDRLEVKESKTFTDNQRIREYNRDIKDLEIELKQIEKKANGTS